MTMVTKEVTKVEKVSVKVCDICGSEDGVYECKVCGRDACDKHNCKDPLEYAISYDYETICTICKEIMEPYVVKVEKLQEKISTLHEKAREKCREKRWT